jgi:hypothetical protein
MINPNDGKGSVHDPESKLPVPMWERGGAVAADACQNCRSHPHPQYHGTRKRAFPVSGGPAPGTYLACPRCDAARPLPNS